MKYPFYYYLRYRITKSNNKTIRLRINIFRSALKIELVDALLIDILL